MIKECPVLLNNDAVTVVLFEDIEVQLPAIGRKSTSVYVLRTDDGRYKVVEKGYSEEPKIEEPEKVEKQIIKPKKKGAKKTTVDDAIESETVIADSDTEH